MENYFILLSTKNAHLNHAELEVGLPSRVVMWAVCVGNGVVEAGVHPRVGEVGHRQPNAAPVLLPPSQSLLPTAQVHKVPVPRASVAVREDLPVHAHRALRQAALGTCKIYGYLLKDKYLFKFDRSWNCRIQY